MNIEGKVEIGPLSFEVKFYLNLNLTVLRNTCIKSSYFDANIGGSFIFFIYIYIPQHKEVGKMDKQRIELFLV